MGAESFHESMSSLPTSMKVEMAPSEELFRALLQEAVDLFEDRCGIGDAGEYGWLVNAKASLHNVCVLCEFPKEVGECTNPGCCFGPAAKAAMTESAATLTVTNPFSERPDGRANEPL